MDVRALDLSRFESVLSSVSWNDVREAVVRARSVLEGRTVWNVNSTARGGGVAEMLISLIGYARGIDVEARWLTITGTAPFFAVTKRIHNRLHGDLGDGGKLDGDARETYEQALVPSAARLVAEIGEQDLVILHDPQTAGLIAALAGTGARVAWRSHVGHDAPNQLALDAWQFLLPYAQQADVCIFSRPSYAWGGLPEERLEFIHPSIDAFSPKNRELDSGQVIAILQASGILDGGGDSPAGLSGDLEVRRRAEMTEDGRLSAETPVVLQVSRWDRLKDPAGVIEGFARHVHGAAHLVLAGPATDAVSDDPEGHAVLLETRERWRQLEPSVRARVHLATLPMDDLRENAVIVNALQRHATVVCQKSIAEGFGLTVAEAMWKGRPVVASRVGGIQDQIEHGMSGLLVDDPLDLRAFGEAVQTFLDDPVKAAAVGAQARRRARDAFLGPEHLIRYLTLFERLLEKAPRSYR